MPALTVTINGTDENRWNRWGLSQNPFPQLARAEYDAAERQLNSLDGDPIKDADDIRKRLHGFDPEFVEGCVERWTPGRRVAFELHWPEDS